MNTPLNPLRLHPPAKGRAIPLVVDSPHSGSILPPNFEFICALDDLRHAEDSYIDQFARAVPVLGGTFLQALINRAYIDLNRAIGDLHPDVCAETIPWPLSRSRRVSFGMGLIRHLIRANEPVYAAPLTLAQIKHRIETVYEPYYEVLQNALTEAKERFGRVLHINLHAMPSISFDSSPEPDIVIGDHDGHSSARAYREWLKQAFERRGLKVVINHPYKGVELTRRFAKPRQGFHSLQLEVNKALYMDEATLAFHDGKNELQALFDDVWRDLADWLQPDEMRHAAE
jgi:N-formylglutamate deformylase